LLSQLYSDSKTYPSDPALYEWEVYKVGTTAAASGGFGDCWKGLFLGHHPVAMKCSHPKLAHEIAVRRAEREMRAWKRLRHLNVLPFIGSVVLESPSRTLFMVSPWMKNGDLRAFLNANPDADGLLLLAQIAAGLEYLHTSDPVIIHGDLKAVNVLISEAGEACIADFGLSDIIAEVDESVFKSQGHSSAWKYGGNPGWQAPELFANYRRTTSSDVFAFGRVIYEVCASRLSFLYSLSSILCRRFIRKMFLLPIF